MSHGFIGNSGSGCSHSFVHHMRRYIGQTVTIFTTSGGASGCGFIGVLKEINCDYVTLSNRNGTPPVIPLNESICSDLDGGSFPGGGGNAGDNFRNGGARGDYEDGCHKCKPEPFRSEVDIPISRIAAFCHNSV